MRFLCAHAVLLCVMGLPVEAEVAGQPWPRHTIDNTSRGADGARPADVNGDGLPDFAVAWEEGGIIRVYLHPGHDAVREAWPRVTVGEVPAPEDAVFVDLDADGRTDVVSATEGDTQTLFVHWAPSEEGAYLDAAAWDTKAIPGSAGKARWMYVLPRTREGGGVELVVGAKEPGACVGVFRPGEDPRDLAAWTFETLAPASWIMTLAHVDLTGDGAAALLYSDRKAPQTRGVWAIHANGERRLLGGEGHEVMFLGTGPLEPGGPTHVVAATQGQTLLHFAPEAGTWRQETIGLGDETGTGKGIAIGDLDGDHQQEIVFSCEHAARRHGVGYLTRVNDGNWRIHTIAGHEGIKFDQVELLDLDGDGDLDVVTCEERTNLGVIWYENPR